MRVFNLKKNTKLISKYVKRFSNNISSFSIQTFMARVFSTSGNNGYDTLCQETSKRKIFESKTHSCYDFSFEFYSDRENQ